MLDIFGLLRSKEMKYSYRPRNKLWDAGVDRVDPILAIKGLKERVKQADILNLELERGPIDHVPLFMEVNVESRDIEGLALAKVPNHDFEEG